MKNKLKRKKTSPTANFCSKIIRILLLREGLLVTIKSTLKYVVTRNIMLICYLNDDRFNRKCIHNGSKCYGFN